MLLALTHKQANSTRKTIIGVGVQVKTFKRWITFKMTKIGEGTDRKNVEEQPMYKVHKRRKSRLPLEHIIENVTERALGVKNLELNKNITVDLVSGCDVALWRDRLGFCIEDNRVRFYDNIVNILIKRDR